MCGTLHVLCITTLRYTCYVATQSTYTCYVHCGCLSLCDASVLTVSMTGQHVLHSTTGYWAPHAPGRTPCSPRSSYHLHVRMVQLHHPPPTCYTTSAATYREYMMQCVIYTHCVYQHLLIVCMTHTHSVWWYVHPPTYSYMLWYAIITC